MFQVFKFVKLFCLSSLVIGGSAWAMEDLGKQLIQAVRNGNQERVTELLDQNAAIDHADNEGFTALTYAAFYGHEPVACLLLDRNAAIGHASDNGWTALILAARNGHESVVRLLLDRNADIQHVNNDGFTALMMAAQMPVCELLVERMLTHCLSSSQKQRFTTLVCCIQRLGCGRDVCSLFKPWLHALATQENWENPSESLAHEEINRIGNDDIKQQLLAKYINKEAIPLDENHG